jgi:hypothetical protein
MVRFVEPVENRKTEFCWYLGVYGDSTAIIFELPALPEG